MSPAKAPLSRRPSSAICYLSVTPPVHGDLMSTELFVYGYLKPL